MALEHGRPDDFDGVIQPDRLYTSFEASKILGVRHSALEQDRVTGALGIEYVKLGSRVRYTGETLKRVIRERTRRPPGANG